VFRNFGKVELKVNESILSEEIDLRVILGIELFQAIDSFGDLELVKFEELNGLVFLFGDKFGLANNVFFVREELLKGLGGLFEDLLFIVLSLDFNLRQDISGGCGMSLLRLGLVLLLAHDYNEFGDYKVVVDFIIAII
jgi:hypothetical protein